MAKKFDMELLDSLKGVDVLDEVSEEKLEELKAFGASLK